MLHDQHGMIRRTKGLLLGLSQCGEGMRDQRDRETTALLYFQRVVDTPRRAGPSITETADDKVCLRCQLV
jgi:hypothetical protein